MISYGLQDKEWDIVEVSKSKIDQFRRIIPLIAYLRNPAMRDRSDPNSPYHVYFCNHFVLIAIDTQHKSKGLFIARIIL